MLIQKLVRERGTWLNFLKTTFVIQREKLPTFRVSYEAESRSDLYMKQNFVQIPILNGLCSDFFMDYV